MKKAILLTLTVGVGLVSFAHKTTHKHATQQKSISKVAIENFDRSLFRTSGIGSTDTLYNVSSTDTPTLYLAGGADSGYVSGPNIYGDMGFAERYDFSTADSSMKVTGVMAIFGGKINPASTKTVNFYAWSAEATDSSMLPIVYTGLPDIALDSVNKPITQLGISLSDTAGDTLKAHMFTTPTNFLYASFFVGYTINYSFSSLAGDTIGVYTTRDGNRISAPYTISGSDTIVNNQNATLYGDGTGWHDNYWDNFGQEIDYFMFPIVLIGNPNGVKGVTRNSFTLYGSYPNPAVTTTNISFALSATADVTVTVTNAAGVVMNTINEKALAIGKHEISLPTAALPAGNYIFLVRTSKGDGIASQFTVVK